MTLRITHDSGFIVLDSSTIVRIEYNKTIEWGTPTPLPVSLTTTAGPFNISVEQLSDLADQGLELAKEAIAMYAAHRMTHPEQAPRPIPQKAYEDILKGVYIKDKLLDTKIRWAKAVGIEEPPHGKR